MHAKSIAVAMLLVLGAAAPVAMTAISAQAAQDQFKIIDSPDEAFEFLRDGLTKFHLGGAPTKQGEVMPEIAKTRP